jgi:FkbM family methyltransferase
MMRARELTFRTANAFLIGALRWLHRRFEISTIYKLGPDGACALFENCWFTYDLGEFGCTGNIDYAPDAENSTRQMLFRRVKPGQVFYDIGAHGGVYSLTLLQRFPELTVHSFEPQPERLLENLALNAVAPNRVHAVALGDETGLVKMTTKERSSNHISDKGERSVPIVRLDDYVRDNKLPSPDWIKIDVEGMELPALRGAEQTLRGSRPTIICEINHLSNRYGSRVSDLVGYLGSLGYSMYALENGELNAIQGEPLPNSADWNYWFVAR